jgi:hypothetical protein
MTGGESVRRWKNVKKRLAFRRISQDDAPLTADNLRRNVDAVADLGGERGYITALTAPAAVIQARHKLIGGRREADALGVRVGSRRRLHRQSHRGQERTSDIFEERDF